jgi:hypothetical protein
MTTDGDGTAIGDSKSHGGMACGEARESARREKFKQTRW